MIIIENIVTVFDTDVWFFFARVYQNFSSGLFEYEAAK